MHYLRVQILRVVDETPPGWVECTFTDAAGRTWRIVDKVPVIGDGLVACTLHERRHDAAGTERVRIDLGALWGVASVEGETRFEVEVTALEERSDESSG